jgi:uncharacterized membrane protein
VKNKILSHQEKIRLRRSVIQSYRAKADARRSFTEKFADWMTENLGSTGFLLFNVLWFVIWIVLNSEVFPIESFDPFPYGFLTMVVSLEAIFLAIIVLISQNRAARIAEIREEVDLRINTIAEGEITKVIQMLNMLLEKNGIDLSSDSELKQMLKPVDSREIETLLEEQLDRP